MDTPSNFKNISTDKQFLRKKTPILQLNNFLMRQGKRYKFYKIFLVAISQLFRLNILQSKAFNSDI